jgi:hypothetical protein
MPTSDVTQRQFFHEPFSETGSWIRRSETVKLSKAGRYYFVGFSPKGQTRKLWLSIETKESFAAMNLLQFPIWSKKIQKFHEVPKKPKGNGCWR